MNALLLTARTDVGRQRTDNQDTFICAPLWTADTALLVVIDGVGGYSGGDRAAALARESIEHYMANPNGDPLSMLREAVVFANNQIDAQRRADPRLSQMCCVLTAAVADARAGKLYFVHVGDTRLYRYRQQVLEKLTQDHSLVGIREDANELTEAEAMHHPRRNEILREVGSMQHRVDDADFLESGEAEFQPDDGLLLCSDGLTDMLTRAQITEILRQSLPLEGRLTQLIELANQQGGRDNITVVLAQNNTPVSQREAAFPAPTPDATRTQRVPTQSGQPDEARTILPANLPAKRLPLGWWAGMGTGFLLATTVAVLLGYQFGQIPWLPFVQPADTSAIQRAEAIPVVLPTDDARLDSLVRSASRRSDHQLILPGDTLRIGRPLRVTDSIQSVVSPSRPTVLLPADSGRSAVGIYVSRPGAVQLENLVVSGFKTGIALNSNGVLHLRKVYFRSVATPIQAAARQDTCLSTTILFSVQNPSVPAPPKPASR